MHIPHWLYDLLVFMAAATLVVPLLKLVKISSVIGYLGAGLLVGHGGFELIHDTDSAEGLAEMGIVFLLFTIGLELSFDRLRRLARLVFGLGLLQVVTGTIVIAGITSLVLEPEASFAIGSALALSSTAFVLQLLTERGERSTRAGQTAFSILLLQDLAIVPLMIIVPLLASGTDSLALVLGEAMLTAAAAVIGVMLAGRYILRPTFQAIVTIGGSELFVVTTLLVVLGLGWLMTLAGLSLALGAFLAGLLLAETQYRHQIEADIRPFRGVLLGLFFMTVGMRIDPMLIWDQLLIVCAIMTGLILLKTVLITGLARLFGTPMVNAIQTGLLVSQGGEFAFVLLGLARGEALITPMTEQILFAAIILSMVVTPWLAALGARIAARSDGKDQGTAQSLQEEADALADHILIIGFGRVGRAVSRVVKAHGMDYIGLDTSHQQIKLSRDKGDTIFYGDAGNIGVLKAAGAARARAAVITIDKAAIAVESVQALRESYSDLDVIVRARDLSHGEELMAAGASAVVPDTLEASLQLGATVLRAAETDEDCINELISSFRADDYAGLSDREGVAAQKLRI